VWHDRTCRLTVSRTRHQEIPGLLHLKRGQASRGRIVVVTPLVTMRSFNWRALQALLAHFLPEAHLCAHLAAVSTRIARTDFFYSRLLLHSTRLVHADPFTAQQLFTIVQRAQCILYLNTTREQELYNTVPGYTSQP